MMKRFTQYWSFVLFAGLLSWWAPASFAQSAQGVGFAPGKGFRQLNFGMELDGYGIPLYAGLDFGVGKMVTIGPRLIFETQGESYQFGSQRIHSRHSIFVPSFRGDYHFSGHIPGLPSELDFYGGLTFGVVVSRATAEYVDNSGDVQWDEPVTHTDPRLWIQLGGRYYFSDHWGFQLEFSTLGYRGDGAVGFTYKF